MNRAIVLDTEVFFHDLHLERRSFAFLRACLETDRSTALLVSEVVILECVSRFRRQLLDAYKLYEQSMSSLKKYLGEKVRAEPILPASIDSRVVVYEDRFRATLVDGFGAKIIEIPSASHKSVLARAIAKRRPFDDNGRGYQDTLMWMSVVGAIKSMRLPSVVLVTNNHKDFFDLKTGNLLPDLEEDLPRDGSIVVRCYQNLDTSLHETFKGNFPSTDNVQFDNELHRSIVESHISDIIEQLNDSACSYSDLWNYNISDLGSDFSVLRVRATAVSQSEVNVQLLVRFWCANVTRWREVNGWDVFSEHNAEVQALVTCSFDPTLNNVSSVDAEFGDIVNLGPQLSRKRSKIE
ncbi:PIN domain-containing protein [Sorangium sp. So ce388]|uniref:PIN domain-containing protein n=1 Tax=Sorangium sp. So ce388 TaxID=3133309 RepID=UPI003F5B6E83